MTDQLDDVIGRQLDRLAEMPRCIGCTVDDMLDEYEAGRVRGIRLDNVPVNPAYIYDPRRETTDD